MEIVLYSEWGPRLQKIVLLCYETETDAIELKKRSPYTKKKCWKLPDLSIKYIGQSKMTFLIFIFTVNIMTSFPLQNR